MSTTSPLTRRELRAALALAAVFFLRMLALFMLVPVLALHVDDLAGATPFLIGLAIGIYGLTQASLQIPFGILSDRVGRVPVITGGLLVFSAGAVVAAFAQHILPLVIGRAVQGAGAVSGATLALAADLTRENQRTKVMAIIGLSIGAAFSLGFVLGPYLDASVGLRGLFLVSAMLGLAAIPLLLFCVPRVPSQAVAVARHGQGAWAAMAAPELRVLYLGVFALHAVLAASFVAIPLALREGMHIPPAQHGTVYLAVLFVSLLVVGPMIMASTRGRHARRIFFGSILGFALAEFLLWLGWHHDHANFATLVLFFAAFNYLEASLPSIISRVAPAAGKGTALGAYSTFQFLGVFAGGLFGGVVAGQAGFRAVPLACAGLCLLWYAVAARGLTGVLETAAED